jgi:flagellin
MNMSGIVLSASVRQNLLSLQSTAALLATTQNALSTGNKVNSALDNPTEFFTAQGLNNRSGDISNLLDGIGNGVQVLQAANTGITSLQSLVSSAQSIANQVLQAPAGYTTKSNITSAVVNGANANNLLGTGATAAANAAATGTSGITTIDLSAATPATNAKVAGTTDLTAGLTDPGSDVTFTINTHTVTLTTGSGTGTGGAFSLSDIESAINTQVGATADVAATDDNAGHLVLTSTGTAGSGDAITTTGTASLGIPAATVNGTAVTPHAALTFKVNNQTVSLAGGSTYTGAQIAAAIQTQVGSTAHVTASYASGKLAITSTGTASSTDAVSVGTFSSGDATQLGFATAAVAATGTDATGGSLSGQVLNIAATGPGGVATTITFGTTGTDVSTLNGLNAALAPNNLQASIDSTGKLTIETTNNAASSTVGAITGSATTAVTGAFAGATTILAPVADPNSQATRASLVSQYNNVLDQINTTAQDSSFNGINLLNGDTLNLTFDETGASKLGVTGVTFNDAGLGLAKLAAGTSFLDNSSANTALSALTAASTTLRTEATSLGSNLSIVQIRQDFNKNLIDVLQTGASNLTLADTNEEAANSQALSTRQSIAVSALALANQSQQSVLQLLR